MVRGGGLYENEHLAINTSDRTWNVVPVVYSLFSGGNQQRQPFSSFLMA